MRRLVAVILVMSVSCANGQDVIFSIREHANRFQQDVSVRMSLVTDMRKSASRASSLAGVFKSESVYLLGTAESWARTRASLSSLAAAARDLKEAPPPFTLEGPVREKRGELATRIESLLAKSGKGAEPDKDPVEWMELRRNMALVALLDGELDAFEQQRRAERAERRRLEAIESVSREAANATESQVARLQWGHLVTARAVERLRKPEIRGSGRGAKTALTFVAILGIAAAGYMLNAEQTRQSRRTR